MASLFLTWDEAKGEQLPHYCVVCATRATDWADWRLCHSRHLVFTIEHTYVDVSLPVCPQHRSLRSFLFPRVGVKKIYDDGLELSRVSPGFVDAVWDYREEQSPSGPSDGHHHGTSSPRMVYVDYQDEDSEEDFYEPRRRRPASPRYARSSSGSSLGRAILIAIAIVCLAPFALVALFILLGLLISFAI